MAQFFIDRPVFAWVIALFILVLGGVAITQLPVAQYPTVAPPSIVVSAAYPGASAQTLENSVISVIEREMNGSPGLIYMESVGQANGTGSITLTFETGTNPDLAQVDVQNRLSRATPRLPLAVDAAGRARRQGALELPAVHDPVVATDPALDPIALGDYAARNVLPEIQRVPGVGQAQLFGTERAMRIWIDPAKLVGFNLSPANVAQAIQAQNAQVSSGTIGDLPNVAGAGHLRHGGRQGSARVGRAVRQHRAARQRRRLDRAAARRGAHRARRAELRHLGPPERQAVDRHRRAALADRQRAGHGHRGAQADGGAVALLPARREVRDPLRQLALRQDLDQPGRRDAGRGGGAGVPGDVPVPAEHPLHDHPDHRRAGRAAGCVRRAVRARLLDQRADDVRHGAGDRHRRRRRDRRGRERRTHHERGGPAAARGDEEGDGADLRRDHRRHGRADLGVRAARLLQRLGRQHLPPVRRGDGVVDRASRPSWRCR